MENAIKLENISNLITSPSSRKTIRLVHFAIHGRHTSMPMECIYVCVMGIPKGKFSKQMKKKLSYRIIKIKRISSGVYWCITWTKSLTNLHKSPSEGIGPSYASNNSEKNAFNPIIYVKSKGIYQPENLMSNGSSRNDDAAQTK